MAIKRYKVIMDTQTGKQTSLCEAPDEKEAGKKALASLPNWQRPASIFDVEEVGKQLPRTMP